MIDLSKMSLDELKQLRRDISNALEAYDSNRRRQALKEIKEVARKYGYTLEDVVGPRLAKKNDRP